jgi:hypothetical protein
MGPPPVNVTAVTTRACSSSPGWDAWQRRWVPAGYFSRISATMAKMARIPPKTRSQITP